LQASKHKINAKHLRIMRKQNEKHDILADILYGHRCYKFLALSFITRGGTISDILRKSCSLYTENTV